MTSRPRRTRPFRHAARVRLVASTLCAGVLAAPVYAHADWHVQLDGVAGLPLARPQSDEFSVGGGGAVAVQWIPTPLLGLLARFDAIALAPSSGPLAANYARPGVGTLETVTIGARLRTSTHALGESGDGLWLELAGGGGLTGAEVRPVASARAGISFGIGRYAFGPFVGYTRVFEFAPTLLAGDAQLGLAGLEFSWSPSPRAVHVAPPFVAARAPVVHRCPAGVTITEADLDHDGCPDPDRDGDGIADARDACPDAPEDRDGFQDDDGCPDVDNDADTVVDRDDRCPDVAENFNGVDDTDGCPDADAARMVQGRIVLAENLRFEFGSARIAASSAPMLDALAATVRSHAEYGTIFIEGHADEIGGDAYNYRLSYSRAHAVVDALIAHGVDPARLDAYGFGRRAPLDHGTNRTARSRNRRVEFVTGGHRTTGRALRGHEFVLVRDEPDAPAVVATQEPSQEVSR